jgi:outer membrane protein, heavy metal efflux system
MTLKTIFKWICLWLFFGLSQSYAQEKVVVDTLQLSYAEAKARLLKHNLTLLAAHYDISIADAEVIQAKMWNNPYFVWNADMYSLEKNTYFDYTNQRLIQINQTFSIAGKHVNTIKLAKINKEVNLLIVQDVIRGLLFELGDKYLTLNALQLKAALFEETLQKYEQLIQNAENKLRVGSIPLNEVTRLKSELIGVRSESIANQNEINLAISELKVLLNISAHTYIRTQAVSPAVTIPMNLDSLVNEAMENRVDLQVAKKQVEYEQRNLKLQRSLAMPDVMLGYQPSDKGSNYVRPYSGIVLEMNVPIFDRNQGNIKKAKIQIDKAQTQNQLNELKIRSEVQQSFEQLQNYRAGFGLFNVEFLQTTEDLNRNAQANYDKKNINLLEYIDLQRIYISNQLQYIDMKNELQRAINHLNFTIGKQIIE